MDENAEELRIAEEEDETDMGQAVATCLVWLLVFIFCALVWGGIFLFFSNSW